MIVTALLASILAAPVPKATAGEPYFPTAVGAKWVMECEHNGRKWESVQEVTGVEKAGDAYLVTVDWRSEKKPFRQVYEVTAAKVARVGPGDERATLFDRSLKAGEGWTLRVKLPDRPAVENTFTVGQAEAVDVPAGKFTAVPVVERLSGGDTVTQWFAPGVGVVKCQCAGSGGERTDVLKSFTPGKDAKK